MNRRTTIAALTLIGAVSFAAVPAFAQTSTAQEPKMPQDSAAPPTSGVVPKVSPLAGVTSGQAGEEAISSSNAPAMKTAPQSLMPKR